MSCCAAAALTASPALAGMHKKSGGMFASKPQRMAARTTQMTPNAGYAARQMEPMYNRNNYGGSRYAGTRYYGNNGYYGGSPYYYGGGYGYSYGNSSVWPYVAASVAPFVASSLWAPGYGYGGYPYNYSNYGGYPYNQTYYGYGYGYSGSTVAAVQRRLGELGYYHGVVDGSAGPRTRAAIAAFESRHGLVVDGTISRPLLGRLGLG